MNHLDTQFSAGGENELKEAVVCYGAELLRYATAILCDYQEAEDIAQDVFLAAYQGRETFDGRRLSAWLHKIAYHRCLNRLKQKNVSPCLHCTETCLPQPSLRCKSSRRMSAHSLYCALWRTIAMTKSSELTRVRPATLRKQYERAKRKLAVLIKNEQEACDEAI